MQLTEQSPSVLASLDWVGAELLSIIQILFFLVLGYIVTRTWIWSRKCASQALLKKKLQDEIFEERMMEALGSEASSNMPEMQTKARQSNAKERRRKEPTSTSPSQGEVKTPALMEVEKVESTSAECEPEEMQPEEVQPVVSHTEDNVDVLCAPLADLAKTFDLNDNESVPSTQSQPDTDELAEIPNLDSSDPEVQGDAEANGLHEISTPELTPRHLSNTATEATWCPSNLVPDRNPQISQEGDSAFQVEDWVPAAAPFEYCQEVAAVEETSAFDGTWRNNMGEMITIQGTEIKFENGPIWSMKERNFRGFIVELGGQEYHAEVAGDGQQAICWSDGDVWTRMSRMQCEAPQHMVFVGEAPPMAGATSRKYVADDTKPNWEVCWNWKKGWCPRGAACEWKHPARS